MFFLASYERQMEPVASSILCIADHVPQVVDLNALYDERESDEIPGPERCLESGRGIL